MGSLNDFAVAQERPEPKGERRPMKSYSVFLLQLAFTMLFVVAAFFIVYGERTANGAAAAFLHSGLSMENSWLFPEEVQPVENAAEGLYRLPCSGEIKKAMVRNSEGGLDIAGFAIAGAEGESVYAMAAGTVSAVAVKDGVYTIQVDHDNSMYSVYSGLKELSVKEGDAAGAENVLGVLGADGLLFAVYINGAPVDPSALFGQISN